MPQLVPIPVLINGESYAWNQILFYFAGNPIYGITKIDWSHKRKDENIYGAGSEPVTIGYGNHEYSASISIKFEEIEPIINLAAPYGGDITLLPPFPLVINFLGTNTAPLNKTLLNCRFLEDARNTKQNDTSLDVTIPIVFAGIVQ